MNSRVAFPRTIKTAYGASLYNWFAATAESGTFETKSSDIVEDSICPAGWQLPGRYGYKSWANLITTTYGLNSSANSSLTLRKIPFAFNLSGYYRWAYAGIAYSGYEGDYFTKNTSSATHKAYNFSITRTTDIVTDDDKSRGFSVRCVQK